MIRFREMVFSVNSFVAAMLALFVSMSIGLERPFWAMATVYIVSQPLTGTVRSKAAYRFAGTAIGAAATVVIVPPLSNAPILLSIALALWICGCQFLSLLDRTPRSYVFMLAGYTAAIIGFPAVNHPDQIFNTAILRAEEIGLGVLCASLVHGVVLPRGVSGVLNAKLAQIERDTRAWVIHALSQATYTPDGKAAELRDRHAIAGDITELHLLSTHLPYDTDSVGPTRAGMAALQDRLTLLMPLVSAIEDRITALRREDAMTSDMEDAIRAVRAWVEGDRLQAPHDALTQLDALTALTPDTDWRHLLQLNLIERLKELMPLLRVGRELSVHLSDPSHPLSEDAKALMSRRSRHPLHIDYGMALLSVAATFVAVVACCAAWIVTGWPEGAIAPMIAAVICSFFATLDDPTPAQRGFMTWTVVSLPLVALYQFVLLPAVHNFVTLSLVLAPTLLILGVLLPRPSLYGRIMPLTLGFVMGIALTNSFSADFAGFANANFAQVAGIVGALFATRLIRVIGPQTAAQRMLRSGWRDLRALATRQLQADVSQWTALMLDRAQLLAPRLAQSKGDERLAAADALRDLRIGVNLIVLRDCQGSAETRKCLDNLLEGVAGYYKAAMDKSAFEPSPSLRNDIDRALREAPGRDVRIALTGLRRNLFPTAPMPAAELA